MLRRIASAAVAGAALLAAFGCGGGGNSASIESGGRQEQVSAAGPNDPTTSTTAPSSTTTPSASSSTSTTSTTAPEATTAGLRTVTYRGLKFDVPANWPVYDLATDPTTCVRFDVSAVYLGHPGADMACPAHIIGRADAVLVEPTDGMRHRGSQAADHDATTGDVAAATTSGLAVQVASESATASEVAADVPSAGLSVTLTYRDSDATAQQILQSFRAAS